MIFQEQSLSPLKEEVLLNICGEDLATHCTSFQRFFFVGSDAFSRCLLLSCLEKENETKVGGKEVYGKATETKRE